MKTTDELIKVLENSDNLETYLENNKDNFSNISFTEYLNALMKKYNLTKSQIINNSNIQKNYAYQIFDGSKKPSIMLIRYLMVLKNLQEIKFCAFVSLLVYI